MCNLRGTESLPLGNFQSSQGKTGTNPSQAHAMVSRTINAMVKRKERTGNVEAEGVRESLLENNPRGERPRAGEEDVGRKSGRQQELTWQRC